MLEVRESNKIMAIAAAVAICGGTAVATAHQSLGMPYKAGSVTDNVFMHAPRTSTIKFNTVTRSNTTGAAFTDADEYEPVAEEEEDAIIVDDEVEVEDSGDEEFVEDEDFSLIMNYDPGVVGDYEQWFRIAPPKGFVYDATSSSFTNEESWDSFSISVSCCANEEGEAVSFADFIAAEQILLAATSDDDMPTVLDRKDITYNGRPWVVLISYYIDEDGEKQITVAEYLTDVGYGEYAMATIYTQPDVPWVQNMLSTFEVLPGDPYANWEAYTETLPSDESTSDSASEDYDSASDEIEEWYYEEEE